MKILSLQADNVLRLVAVRLEIDPQTGMLVIGGANGAGKTSVLNAIEMALGGKDSIPDQPIRQGASRARIVLQTDEITVSRSFSASGISQLVVTAKDGSKVASPQALLDKLTNTQCLDPLAFTRLKPDAQAETLRKLVGIDFEAVDAEYKRLYDERTGVNREVKSQQVRVDGLNNYPDAPKELVTIDEIAAKLEEAQKRNADNADARLAAEEHNSEVGTMKVRLGVAEEDLRLATLAVEKAKDALAVYEAARDHHAKFMKTVQDVEIAPILEEMKAVEVTNEKVRANETWKRESNALVLLTRKSQAITDRLAAIEAEKETALQKAKFPVQGLSFTADGVTFNGVPFSQASSAEQLRVSVSMGFAMQPQLKLALIRDGSLLDEKSLAMVAEMATENGATVLVERVGKGAECSVIMADGEVSEDRTRTKK